MEAIKEYQKQWYKDNKEAWKKYYKDNKEAILELQKRYREDNKETRKEYRKQYYKDNQEAIKQYLKDNKEKISERNKQYQKNNKEILKEHHKQYCKEHRDICNMITQRYKARKKILPNTLTVEQWDSVKHYFNNRCAYCGEEEPLTQEHFIALSNGGEYTHNNIVPACQSCNSSKGAKAFEEWYPQQTYYSPKREQKIYKFLNYDKGEQQLIMHTF